MKTIASFLINHSTLTPGLYTSRVDGDVITYDLRVSYPNSGRYPAADAIHSFEHLFATFARNGEHGGEIVYFGPMGCQTGFYLLTRDTVPPARVIELIQSTLERIAAYEGELPGSKPVECGNAALHSLEGAKEIAKGLLPTLEGWTVERLRYPA